ncbi:MAG: RluA family pseudouridine synthase [Bacteroidales bacterium]|nr:RluA family pseudouridine synthase [Bacteroidales bacterium]
MNNNPGIKIVFEDKWLVVVEKDCGLLSMGTGHPGETTAYSLVTAHVRKVSRDRHSRVFIVHRLDRDTSGLLVFAKDAGTKQMLQEHWDEAVLEREYVAILEGRMAMEEGEIRTWLREDPVSMTVHCSDHDNGGRIAVSYLKVLRQGREYSQVSFELETGRKNQIRAHASWIGHPVAGDRKYGARSNPLNRLCLHARSLVFIHPRTGEKMRFRSNLPRSFKRLFAMESAAGVEQQPDKEIRGRREH